MKSVLKKPYKDTQNRWLTSSLFWDHWITVQIKDRQINPIFCLHDDKEGLINCRKTFVAMNDPTGYKWAMEYLGDYAHFKYMVQKCKWFREALEIWREELKIKIQSEAIEIIKLIATKDEKQSMQAAKYLAEYSWDKPTAKRGRPSAAEITGELKKAVEERTVEDEDFERIRLVK